MLCFFFFNDTATTEIYTLSLHDALPICFLYLGIGSNSNITERGMPAEVDRAMVWQIDARTGAHRPYATGLRNPTADRKSTRLNSSHANISYAVFCLKKKNHQ